jgi:hypothetical protein
MRVFARTIGIDYSGAETPTASLKGLGVYLADGDGPPAEVPLPSPRKYWTANGPLNGWCNRWPIGRVCGGACRGMDLGAAADTACGLCDVDVSCCRFSGHPPKLTAPAFRTPPG